LPDKLSGRPRYVHDLTLDGMVYGKVVRPPSRGATLRDIDTGPAEDLPGVIAVVRDGDFLAVVAEHEETALRAADLLRRDAHWDQRPTLPDENELPAFLTSAPADTTVVADVGHRTTSGVARSFTASYHRPYLAHGSIGPSCAVAVAADDRLEIWTHSQGVHMLRREIGRALAIPRTDSWSGTSTARAATGTTAQMTRRWTPRCSRWPHRADRCRWCGREPTN